MEKIEAKNKDKGKYVLEDDKYLLIRAIQELTDALRKLNALMRIK